MRVVCVQPARDPVICGDGPVRIGCAPDDDVVLGGIGVAPHHVSIVADARGLVLQVASSSQRVYVNARAVRERALLHYGDTLTLGGNKLLVTTDAPSPAVAAPMVEATATVEPVALRVVSGKASGRALAAQPELHLGAGTRHFGELPFACRIVQTADGLVFESESADGSVNGWRCGNAMLAANDQITLGEHRLVVEAPGLQYAAYLASLPPPQPVAHDEPEVAGGDSQHAGVWWLIVAAAVLAVIIALLLYFHR